MTTVLIVEDNESFVEAVSIGLRREGFDVAVAMDGREALDVFDAVRPDVVLLDVMLPRLSGIDVCREIRSRSTVPVVMVTARDSELDAVVGLEVGADDYVTKPFGLRELVARIRAVLRRNAGGGPGAIGSTALEYDGVRLDVERHEFTVDGVVELLPRKQFELLEVLMGQAGRVVTRENLISLVWGGDYFGDTKTLDVHVKRLRSKLDRDPAKPSRITTIRGVGYRFELPPAGVSQAS